MMNKKANHEQILPSTPRLKAIRRIGSSSSSVVMWVRSARFFTSPQDSPSGVSEGHNIPHWDPLNNDKALDKRKGVLVIFTWRARGPLTFRVFSNCEVILVIIPNVEMKDNRANTYFCRLAPKTWFQEKKIMYLSDSCTFHLESLEAPIACRYRSG